jgi:hypothetical protein
VRLVFNPIAGTLDYVVDSAVEITTATFTGSLAGAGTVQAALDIIDAASPGGGLSVDQVITLIDDNAAPTIHRHMPQEAGALPADTAFNQGDFVGGFQLAVFPSVVCTPPAYGYEQPAIYYTNAGLRKAVLIKTTETELQVAADTVAYPPPDTEEYLSVYVVHEYNYSLAAVEATVYTGTPPNLAANTVLCYTLGVFLCLANANDWVLQDTHFYWRANRAAFDFYVDETQAAVSVLNTTNDVGGRVFANKTATSFGTYDDDDIGTLTIYEALGVKSFSAGYRTRPWGSKSITIGNSARTGFATINGAKDDNYDGNQVAVGNSAAAFQPSCVAIGEGAVAGDSTTNTDDSLQRFSTAIGPFSSAVKGSLAIGYAAQVTAETAIAVGAEAIASGYQSAAFGRQSIATKERSSALGTSSHALAPYAIVVSNSGVNINQAFASVVGNFVSYTVGDNRPTKLLDFTTNTAITGNNKWEWFYNNYGPSNGWQCDNPVPNPALSSFEILTTYDGYDWGVMTEHIKLGDIIYTQSGAKYTVVGNYGFDLHIYGTAGWVVDRPPLANDPIIKIIPRNLLEISRSNYNYDPAGYWAQSEGHTTDDLLAFYIDYEGKIDLSKHSKGISGDMLAVFATVTHTHDYSEIENAPTITPGGSVAWADITGKPSTFPPTIGTSATTAMAGNTTAKNLGLKREEYSNSIIIPLYQYPVDVYTNTAINGLIAIARKYNWVKTIAIINPSSGPGGSEDGNYTALLKRLQGAGITVVGYVATNYTSTAIATVKAAVDTWLSLYPRIDGIFIDEMTNSDVGGNVAYYTELTAYIHSKSLYLSIGNPGSGCAEEYFSNETADIIAIYESATVPTESELKGDYGGGYSDYDYTKRACLVYNQATLDEALVAMVRKYCGSLFITDQNTNPWAALPPYLEQLYVAVGKYGEVSLGLTTMLSSSVYL